MDMIWPLLFVLLLPTPVLADSHSLAVVSTYIKGNTPFPEFSFTLMLDDITVGYFDSEKKTPFPRGLDKPGEADDVIDLVRVKSIGSYLQTDLEERRLFGKQYMNITDDVHVQQRLVLCELLDNDQPGQFLTKTAFRGSTVDELRFHEGRFSLQSDLDITVAKQTLNMELSLWRHEHQYYPLCIEALRGYLQKRSNQVRRKVKPRVRLLQRRRSVSGWDGITCLATGFYPRHINLTILRDGQPVPDHLTTGGDLLPNGDGTYQMRRNLELREEELKEKQDFTCTVTHLSLDNKLDVHLDFDPGEPITSILSCVVVVVLVSVSVMVVVIWMIYRRKRGASSRGEYSSTCSTEQSGTSLDDIKN